MRSIFSKELKEFVKYLFQAHVGMITEKLKKFTHSTADDHTRRGGGEYEPPSGPVREISPSRNLQKSQGNTALKSNIWRKNHIKIVDRIKKQQQTSNDKYNPPIFKKVS